MNQAPNDSGEKPKEIGPKTMRVLIVEDDKTSRIVLRRILEGIGDLEVIEADDGRKAWELLEGGLRPKLCFFDINMPNMSGLQLLQRIRNDKRLAPLKVCFCSAVRDREVIMEAAAYQPDYYILKPYSRNTILSQVQKARGDVAVSQTMDSAEVVCTRLGIDRDTYLSMLDMLMSELQSLTSKIPTMLTQLNISGAVMALDGAKSAAETLGAHRALSLADNLAKLVKSSSSAVGQGSVSQDDLAVNLPKWLARSTDQLFQIMQELRGELETIRQVAGEVAKTHIESKSEAESAKPRVQAELDAMTRFIMDVFQRGKLLSASKSIRSKSLTVPVKASILGQNTERMQGVLTRKTSFSLAILDPATASAIEDCRGINDLIKLLSYPLDEGARWIPSAAISLLEDEIAWRNEHGIMLLREAIGDNLDAFLAKQEQVVRGNLNQLFEQLQGKPAPDERIQDIMNDIRERLQPALEGYLTTQPLFSALDIGNLTDTGDDEKWAVPFSLLYHAAMLFRNAATEPSFDRQFKFNTFDRDHYIRAMDVLGDPIAYQPDAKRAAQEKESLGMILGSSSNRREKCRQVWNVVRGESPDQPGSQPPQLRPIQSPPA